MHNTSSKCVKKIEMTYLAQHACKLAVEVKMHANQSIFQSAIVPKYTCYIEHIFSHFTK